jgi:hypothetical protein
MERPFDTASSLRAARQTAAQLLAEAAEHRAAVAAFAHCVAARNRYFDFIDEIEEQAAAAYYPRACAVVTNEALDRESAADAGHAPDTADFWVAARDAAIVRAGRRLADDGIDINDLLGCVIY